MDISNAADHIFGCVLMNDWSARDIQDSPPLPYLAEKAPKNYDISLEVCIKPAEHKDTRVRTRWRCTISPTRTTRSKVVSRNGIARCWMQRGRRWPRFDARWTPQPVLCLERKCSHFALRLEIDASVKRMRFD